MLEIEETEINRAVGSNVTIYGDLFDSTMASGQVSLRDFNGVLVTLLVCLHKRAWQQQLTRQRAKAPFVVRAIPIARFGLLIGSSSPIGLSNLK